ncbi:sigma-54-dependent transcriptional regulator [Candidatus Magnetominusculus dajiuhuensis]|uniref:sigma-54-dependent transcriptional regulator n=1 Tax=Candidatus Magnetominusculus dajiuhuensis TaxID=3137712 RepID=UPI003B431A58
MKLKILVAEDEEITLNHIVYVLEKEGYETVTARDGEDALAKIEKGSFHVLISDIKMPKLNGIRLLEIIKEKYPEIEVIIITAFGSIESAVEAMRKGASDYITKPFELDELILKVSKLKERKLMQRENTALKAALAINKKFSVTANSPGMKRIVTLIESMKGSDCNLILTGESGVGKSLIARLIHYSGKRQDRPYLSINCATLTEELLSSELFGYEAGAFTGALKTKQGLVEIADSGTLFLDEIAELSPNLQAKLLLFIEEGEFFRVGGVKSIKVNVRIIAATNKNITNLLSTGKFREDLYYRLNVMEITIPPLRERINDINELCLYFLKKHAPRCNKKITAFTSKAMEILMNYNYPGNVRELENIIERAVILENTNLITPESLPQKLSILAPDVVRLDAIKTIDELNKEYAMKIVEYLGGNKTKAAEMLGISRTSLWKIIKEEC